MTTDSVIAASAGILAGACFGFFYQRLTKCMAPQTKSHDDGNNSKGEHELYQTMLNKVGAERDAILDRIDSRCAGHSL